MKDVICTGGDAILAFTGPVKVGIALDLLCYGWDHINYAKANKVWRNNTEPDLEKYIHYVTSTAISGTGDNFNHIQGDYVYSGLYQFQATTLFSNEKGREPPQGVFITPKYRSRAEYDDNGILINQNASNFKLTDKNTRPFGDDLDYRVKNGSMRKKGPYYIWLENYESMHNGDGENTYQSGFGPWNTTASRYILLRTNISKCLSSWSIREKDYLTTVVSRNKEGELSNTTIIKPTRVNIKLNDTNIENNKDIFLSLPDYNLFSMKNMFQGAITDKALFEPVHFSNADLPFINNDTISQDAQKLNKLADKVALINMEPKIYKYNLYNSTDQQETSYDGLRWNLSGFSDLSYFFANTRVCFIYGPCYKYWLDVGSSPAHEVSLPPNDYTERIKEQYITSIGNNRNVHYGIFIPIGNDYHHSLDHNSRCDIYKLRDELDVWEYGGRGGTAITTPQTQELLKPLPHSLKFKNYISKTVIENNKKNLIPLPLYNQTVRENNISTIIWGRTWKSDKEHKKVKDIINNKNNTWGNKKNLVCKIMAEEGKFKYISGKNKDNVELKDYYDSIDFKETYTVDALEFSGYGYRSVKNMDNVEEKDFTDEEKNNPHKSRINIDNDISDGSLEERGLFGDIIDKVNDLLGGSNEEDYYPIPVSSIHNYSEDRIKMSRIIIESIKPDGSLPEPDWNLIEQQALTRELKFANNLYPTGWNRSEYRILKKYDIEVIVDKMTLDLSRPLGGETAFREGTILKKGMVSNYNPVARDYRLEYDLNL